MVCQVKLLDSFLQIMVFQETIYLFKYIKRVYENRKNVWTFLLLRRIGIGMTNPCLQPISTEIFRIFSAPFDFSNSSRNIELLVVVLRVELKISYNPCTLIYRLIFSYFLLCLRRFEAMFNINSLILTGGRGLLGKFQRMSRVFITLENSSNPNSQRVF